MNTEIYTMLTPIMTAFAGRGLGWMMRSSRRKSAAEADKEEISALHMALEQIKDLQREMADKTEKIRSLTADVIDKMGKIHRLEMELISTRCDRRECPRREPPLPWMRDEVRGHKSEVKGS